MIHWEDQVFIVLLKLNWLAGQIVSKLQNTYMYIVSNAMLNPTGIN